MPDFMITHNAAASRFEAQIDGWLCRCDYRVEDGALHLVHTEVPHAVEGRGIAAALVRAALAWAEASGMTVVPRCSYVLAYLRRHPETGALLASGSAAR